MNDVQMIPGMSEAVEPDGYLQPARTRVFFRCGKCGYDFNRVYKVVPSHDPACPNKRCAEDTRLAALERENENLRKMLEEGHAPAQIGKNVRVKAVDATADIVMSDYSMTDLKDGIRPGENMAPKLPPAAQAQADNYFASNPLRDSGVNKKQADMLRRRAIGGAFRNMAVAPTAIAPAAKPGAPALVSVGSRSNDLYRGQRR